MRLTSSLPLAALVGLTACGSSPKSSPPALNPFLGTLTISSAAATNTCGTVAPVVFTATGVDRHTITIAGGDCLSFTNSDTGAHQPSSIGTPTCPGLDGPVLTNGQTFTTAPFTTAGTCHWQDALNPPSTGGGGGGGY